MDKIMVSFRKCLKNVNTKTCKTVNDVHKKNLFIVLCRY